MEVINFLISILKSRFIEQIYSFIFYGGGLFLFLKVSVSFYSQRLFSFYWLYKHRHRLFNHKVFQLIDSIEKRRDIAVDVMDPIKKEIIADIFAIELHKIRQILKMNLRRLFKRDIKSYIKTFADFKSENIVNLFYSEYINNRVSVESNARIQLTRFGMPHEDFNRLWRLYQEIHQTYEIIVRLALNKYLEHRDIYKATFLIMDEFAMLVELIDSSLALHFNRLNGRSYGIAYKGGKIGSDGK